MAITIHKKGVQTSARKPRPLKYTSLMRQIGPDRMAIVDSLLLNNTSCDKVAKVIKEDWKLLPTYKLHTLATKLREYRRDRLLVKLTLLSDRDNPTTAQLSAFAEKVDVLENLTKLVELQQGRVSKALAHEQSISAVGAQFARREVLALGLLYKQLSDLQMDLGLLRKVPAKLTIEGGASRAQQAVEEAFKRSSRVETALSKAYAVLEGAFSVVKDGTAQTQH